MDSRNRAIIIQAIIAGIAIIAVTWGTRYNWPDYVHVKHGLPLTWGIHTLSTIVGPADTWEINLVNMTLDLAIWLALILLLTVYLSRKLG
jgi:hypothetical protein